MELSPRSLVERLRDVDRPGWPEVAQAPWNTIAVPEEGTPPGEA